MKLRVGILLASLFGLAGCYEIDVRLDTDGSGSARIALTTPYQQGVPFEEGPVRDLYRASGVHVEEVTHLDVLDRRRVLVTLTFDHLSQLAATRALQGLSIECRREEDRFVVEGSYRDPNPAALRQPSFQNLPVRVGVRLPGVVRESSGEFSPSGRRVLWETTTDALAAAPLSLRAVSGLEFEEPGPGRAGILAVIAAAIALPLIGVRRLGPSRAPLGFLLAGGVATLAYEVILTRLFSAVFWYHFAFMAISVALLGQGAGASLVTALGPRSREGGRLGRPLLLTAVAIVAVLGLMTRHTRLAGDSSLGFALLFLLAALPFLAFGSGVARVFEEAGEAPGRLYFANLLGAAAGTVAAIPLLSLLGAESALLVVALFASAAGLALARGLGKVPAFAICALLALLALANGADGPLRLRTGKGGSPKAIDLARWNAFSLITVGEQLGSSWAVGESYRSGSATSVGMEIDLNAFTPIVRWRGDSSEIEETLQDVTALVHRVKRDGRVLVIGPGGGKDVLAALSLGARHVTAVEINPLIAHIVRDRFNHFTGGLYTHPKVDLVVMNGRTFVDETSGSFDVIQASLVDTWAASASGAFALTENHLYTQEAFVSYLSHLSPGGMLSVSRWHHEPPRESLRLLALSLSALEEMGVKEPLRHVAIVFAGSVATALVGRDPIDAPMRDALRLESEAMGFELALGGDPAPGATDPVRRLLAGGAGAIADVAWDYSPPHDDRPFFFHTVRRRDYLSLPWSMFSGDLMLIEEINAQAVWVVMRLLVVSSVAAAALIFGPLLLARRRLGRVPWGLPLLYFSCLGTGFVFIVSGHIGRLSVRLGNPTLAFVTLTFATLLGASAGAALSPRLRDHARAAAFAVPAGLLAFALLLGIPALRHPLLLGSLMMLQGVLLGLLFPLGLEAIRDTGIVPWAFAANGALSVVGSSLSLVLALLFGFQLLLLAGVALYLVAASSYLVLARRA